MGRIMIATRSASMTKMLSMKTEKITKFCENLLSKKASQQHWTHDCGFGEKIILSSLIK